MSAQAPKKERTRAFLASHCNSASRELPMRTNKRARRPISPIHATSRCSSM